MTGRRSSAAGVAVATMWTAWLAVAPQAGAAVGIWLTTSTRMIGETYTISARVDALQSGTTECPARPNDPTDGETYCAYITTDIQIMDPAAGWMSFATAKGAGPISHDGPTRDGRGSFTLTSWCPTKGEYRSYFAQKVTDVKATGLEEWTDERWNEPRELACQLPPLEHGP